MCRLYGISSRELARHMTIRELGIGPRRHVAAREIQRQILIARLQVNRADRACQMCGRLIPPRRQASTRYCSDACRTGALRERRARA